MTILIRRGELYRIEYTRNSVEERNDEVELHCSRVHKMTGISEFSVL